MIHRDISLLGHKISSDDNPDNISLLYNLSYIHIQSSSTLKT
jgi:hypothetical protein